MSNVRIVLQRRQQQHLKHAELNLALLASGSMQTVAAAAHPDQMRKCCPDKQFSACQSSHA